MIRQEGSFGGVNEFFIKSVIKSQFLRIRYRKAIHLHKERKLIIMSEEKKIPLQPGVNMKEQDIRLQPGVNLKDKEKLETEQLDQIAGGGDPMWPLGFGPDPFDQKKYPWE